MSNVPFGKLERVELRQAWISEAGHFTPWLAQPENIALLSDAIGIDLDVEAQEKDVGPFRADILCKDVNTENWVLIENQLERTDHTHLGQLLTYAAGLHAVTIVWIAQRFTDEHRAALDWLNDVTSEEIAFFGLEVELWRIGNSPVAPKFNIISSPNEWKKTIDAGKPAKDLARLRYWQAFLSVVLARAPEFRPGKARDDAGLRFSSERKRIDYRVQASRLHGEHITAGLAVRGNQAAELFRILKQDCGAIEAALGMTVKWVEIPNRNIFHIRASRPAVIDSQDDWSEQHDWLLNTLLKFKRVMDPRIAALPPMRNSDSGGDTDDEEGED